MKRRSPLLLAAIAALFVTAAAAPRSARAEVGFGVFLGEPTGLTLKLDLSDMMALEFLGGVTGLGRGHRDRGYVHATVLFQLAAVQASSVIIPFRLGIGGAIYHFEGPDVAARAPFQVGFRFTGTPIELYLELALRLQIIQDVDLDLDGGVGVRIYF
jgi:hypothetical protein